MTAHADSPRLRAQRGFTVLELLIALTVLLIGITGILLMQMISLHATSYSRHATEAAVLAEGKVEALRTLPLTDPGATGQEQINAQGKTTGDKTQDIYRREWTTTVSGTVAAIEVRVSWMERGSEPHTIFMRTQRAGP